jgi:hypothetical protein
MKLKQNLVSFQPTTTKTVSQGDVTKQTADPVVSYFIIVDVWANGK